MPDDVHRFRENPLVTPEDLQPSRPGMRIECVMNPGVFAFQGLTWLIMRIAERPVPDKDRVWVPYFTDSSGIGLMEFSRSQPGLKLDDPRYVINDEGTYLSTLSHLRLMCSKDGRHFEEPKHISPFIFGVPPMEEFGVEDCRVTQIGNEYYLTYTQVSRSGVAVGMMSTSDWKEFRRYGTIFPPHNKDCAIFPEKVNGLYYCFHRPSGLTLGGHFMWISASDDLVTWGKHHCLMHTRPGMWDSERVGAGAAPVKTPEGWLAIYHAADDSHVYRLGAILLDLQDPTRIIARSKEPIMEPTAPYELHGFFDNVIFTNGHLVKGDSIHIYYGAADRVICAATLSIGKIMDTLT